MEDSAAATVKINKEKTCPTISSKWIEENIKLKLIDKNIISKDINITKIFFWFKKIPKTLIKNIKDDILIQLNWVNILHFFYIVGVVEYWLNYFPAAGSPTATLLRLHFSSSLTINYNVIIFK